MIKPTCACRRRHWLAGAAALAAAGLAGGLLAACGRDADPALAAAPRDFGADTACDLDGMVLAEYPGPKAQLHYAGQAAPLFLCDTVELFSLLLRPEQVRPLAAAYVQDMARADWERPRGFWTDARGAWYVRGSRRRGAMGPTFASFAQEADARRFAAEWGGQVLRFAEVTPAMADLGGGADFDARM